MIEEIIKQSLTRSLAAAFVSEDHVEGAIRPLLERFGLPRAEVDALVAEARANVRKWKETPAPDAEAVQSAGAAAMRNAFGGAPARTDIDALKRRFEELSRRSEGGGEKG